MRYLALFLFCLLVTSNALAIDKKGIYLHMKFPCKDAITGHAHLNVAKNTSKHPLAWKMIGFIEGYMAATNFLKEGKKIHIVCFGGFMRHLI